MGILADILGTGEVIKQGFDLIDDMHTSDEEAIKAKVNGKVALLSAYHPFKKAQRVLALLFALNFTVCFWMVMYFALSGADPSSSIGVINAFYLGEIMLTIIVFYFGGGFLEGAIEKRNAGAINVAQNK